MKLTNKQLRQIIKEELQHVLQEQEPRESLVQKINEMAYEFGIEDYYSSKDIEPEVIEAAVSFINQNSVDNVFDPDLEHDRVDDWEDDVLRNEDAYNDLDMFVTSGNNKEFIFALYAGYYS